MDWFKIIKDNYDKGLYTVEQVYVFAEKGKITKEEANKITEVVKYEDIS